jgi:hypothetical protein
MFKHIRLYGEEFEVVSDPFPEANGVAVLATTKQDSYVRVLRIPVTVLQRARRAETPLAPIRVETVIASRGERASVDKSWDHDRSKGATERSLQNPGEDSHTGIQRQLGHRAED